MVFLSATEYRLLLQFVHNLGSILTSEDLLVNVWGPEYRDDKEILWVSISRLRQNLRRIRVILSTLLPVQGWAILCHLLNYDCQQKIKGAS
jgi:DNA-binding response OmpR family regulator